jgi:nicotinate-nucleotide adenylyltransferase
MGRGRISVEFGRSEECMDKRIGVLGGTFNPVHCGHLHIAREIQRLFALSQVQFVVATVPPHKGPEDLVPFMHRYAMVSLATAGIPGFLPSLVELERQASPFSIDTLRKLARRAGSNSGLYFIAGGDSLPEVKSWRHGGKLLNSYNFVFAMRPGAQLVNVDQVLPPQAARLVVDLTGLSRNHARRTIAQQKNGTRIYLVDVGALAISATRIRSLVSSGRPFSRMVPGPVREYIQKLHLYGGR